MKEIDSFWEILVDFKAGALLFIGVAGEGQQTCLPMILMRSQCSGLSLRVSDKFKHGVVHVALLSIHRE